MSLVLRIPRRLESPNKSRGAHWRVRHRIAKEWEQEIGWSVVAMQTQDFGARAGRAAAGLLKWGEDKKIPMPVPARMRVEIQRHVPDGRCFIRDDDNLAFASKPILDALKRMGYIKDDSRKWLEHPLPTQHVSADGKNWTIVTITPCDNE